MTKAIKRRQPASPAAVDLDAELARIAAMNTEELRHAWRRRRKQEPPPALSKDLMARALAYWLQEEHLGGLSPQLRKLLRSYASSNKTGSPPPRRVKTGSIIVREYQGKLHEVLVVPDGFCWQGHVYSSLSTIAHKITGTNWNGPRFFGLRGAKESKTSEKAAPKRAPPGTASPARPSRPDSLGGSPSSDLKGWA